MAEAPPRTSAWGIQKALRQVLAYAVRSRLVEENVARLVPNPEPKRPEVPVFDSLAGMERDESHHHMFRKTMAVVTTVVTRSSHSGREIDDGLARMMANQLCLQLGGFWQLVDCPLDEPSSTGLVRERCVGGRNPFRGR